MPGRKPKPTALKQLAGNPGKRRLNEREPQPPPGTPVPPDDLSPDALSEWNRVAPMLLQMGVLTQVDTTAFVAYCESYSRWREAEKQIRRYGAVVKSPTGFPIQSPYLAISNRALTEMRKFLVEFGMTPASRSKVQALPIPTTTQDEWSQFASVQ